MNREKFAELKGKRKKYNAQYDVMVIRKCFLKLIKNFSHLHQKIKNEI